MLAISFHLDKDPLGTVSCEWTLALPAAAATSNTLPSAAKYNLLKQKSVLVFVPP